ncbi:MAG: rod-binding protein, partial [Mariprofundaceae bacterium]|nr:rod-binding protein [Mariprofundaceae bacterium]
LVETVIGQVLKKDALYNGQKNDLNVVKSSSGTSFKSDFMKHINDKKQPMFVGNTEIKDPSLWQASLKFEGMLFKQMMQAMRKTIPDGGLVKHGFAQGVQDSMFDQAVSDAASQRGHLGLAMNIYRQMEQSSGVNLDAKQQMIQAAQKAADSEKRASLSALRGGIHDTP